MAWSIDTHEMTGVAEPYSVPLSPEYQGDGRERGALLAVSREIVNKASLSRDRQSLSTSRRNSIESSTCGLLTTTSSSGPTSPLGRDWFRNDVRRGTTKQRPPSKPSTCTSRRWYFLSLVFSSSMRT